MDIVARPSPSYSITIRLQYPNREGMLGKVTSVIGDAGGDIGAVDIVESRGNRITRDITIDARDERHSGVIVERVRAIEDLKGGTVHTVEWGGVRLTLQPTDDPALLFRCLA